MARGQRQFGSIRLLPSGRFQARYIGPDGQRYTAQTPAGRPRTFTTKGDAGTWLDGKHTDIERGVWVAPGSQPSVPEEPARPVTFGVYAEQWMADRASELAQTTYDHYTQLLRDHINPTFQDTPLSDIKPAGVRAWHGQLARAKGKKIRDRPTTRAHAYGLLRTILGAAVADHDQKLISVNPCHIKGAGVAKRAVDIETVTLDELTIIVAKMPPRYQLMVLWAAWCALRFGELAELRRSDVDVVKSVVRIRRGVTRSKGKRIVKGPKSEAGKRSVDIPPHLMSLVIAHLRDHVGTEPSALLWPSSSDPNRHLAPSTLYKVYYPAREAAHRPDLRFHDLRHTGAVLTAATGATIAELKARLGHATFTAAMRYQHASKESGKRIAAALSGLVAVPGDTRPQDQVDQIRQLLAEATLTDEMKAVLRKAIEGDAA
jgi:integrase